MVTAKPEPSGSPILQTGVGPGSAGRDNSRYPKVANIAVKKKYPKVTFQNNPRNVGNPKYQMAMAF